MSSPRKKVHTDAQIKRRLAEQFSTIEHNSSAKLLLMWLELFGPATRIELCEQLHVGEATLKRSIKLLRESGYISENPREVRVRKPGD